MRQRILILMAVLSVSAAVSTYALRRAPAAARIKMASCLRQIEALPQTRLAAPTDADAEAMWKLLAGGGQIVLMRHAQTTPGSGDPPNFDLRDRATQRNLSPEGREMAAQIGHEFLRHHVPISGVISSQLFRCQDTARLAFGRVEVNTALNPLFEKEPGRSGQISSLTQLASTAPSTGNNVLVTHQTDIAVLTNQIPAMGECVIVTPHDRSFTVTGLLKAY